MSNKTEERNLLKTAIDYYQCGELNNAINTKKIIHEKLQDKLESYCLASKI